MNIASMMEGGNTLFMVTANDLKEFALALIEESRKQVMENEKEEVFLNETEVCNILAVTHSTLWRWNKKGYLRCVKMGRKNLWKQSDIEKLMKG